MATPSPFSLPLSMEDSPRQTVIQGRKKPQCGIAKPALFLKAVAAYYPSRNPSCLLLLISYSVFSFCLSFAKSTASSSYRDNASCFCTGAGFSWDIQFFSLQIRQEVSLCLRVRPWSPSKWPLEIEQQSTESTEDTYCLLSTTVIHTKMVQEKESPLEGRSRMNTHNNASETPWDFSRSTSSLSLKRVQPLYKLRGHH